MKLLGIDLPDYALLLEYHIACQKIKIDKVRLAWQVLVLNRRWCCVRQFVNKKLRQITFLLILRPSDEKRPSVCKQISDLCNVNYHLCNFRVSELFILVNSAFKKSKNGKDSSFTTSNFILKLGLWGSKWYFTIQIYQCIPEFRKWTQKSQRNLQNWFHVKSEW